MFFLAGGSSLWSKLTIPSILFYSVLEPDLILRMCLLVNEEFYFIKLIHLRNHLNFSFHEWFDAMLLSRTSALPPAFLISFSLLEVQEWLKQLLIVITQPLGVDREELVCTCCVIYLPGTFPTVVFVAHIFLIRKKCGHLFEWKTRCPKKLCLGYKEYFDISTVW